MVRVRHMWALLLIAAATARSSPGDTYWISYDASSGLFPEQNGWTRHIAPEGGALRYFEDGAFVIDSRASISIVDYYDRLMHGHLDPGLGEEFVMRWRIRIDEVSQRDDQGAGFVSDHNWKVSFHFGMDTVYSGFEPGVMAHYAPGIYHDFELRTADMQRYVLSIDGTPAINGDFWNSAESSRVWWGDGVQGDASLAHWERFEFGVVPESSSGLLGLIAVFLGKPWSRRSTGTRRRARWCRLGGS